MGEIINEVSVEAKNPLRGKVTVLDTIQGKSAYEVAVINGFKGTEAEWLESLKGDKGEKGETGPQGPKGDTATVDVSGLVEKFDGSKESGNYRFTVYGQDFGEQVNIPYASSAKEFCLAQYTSGGNLVVADPRNNTHAVTKGYVDNGLAALVIPNVISGGGKHMMVTDVSPLAHKCSCQLTSDTYEVGGGESNNIYYFNADNMVIFPYNNYGMPSHIPYVINENGTITFNGTTDAYISLSIKFHLYGLENGKTYTFSVRSNQNEKIIMQMFAANDWSSMSDGEKEGTVISETFVATDADGHHWCDINCLFPIEAGVPRQIENFIIYPQLELGDKMTEWSPVGGSAEVKPYIEDFSTVKVNVDGTSYTPSKDGVVTDIDSKSPNMTITTDNEHVNITNFFYYVDTKAYVDNAIANLKAELQGVS